MWIYPPKEEYWNILITSGTTSLQSLEPEHNHEHLRQERERRFDGCHESARCFNVRYVRHSQPKSRALAVFRDFPWRKVLPYSIAQTAGAFVAAALVYRNYLPAFKQVDPQLEKTAGVFTTFPAFPALPQAGFLDQVIGTALLLLLILAITDEFNSPPGANLSPVMIGLVVVAIGMSYGGMHGYPINPARDFGPRLFTVLAGFRNNGLTDGTGSWWVPMVAPLLGGLVGAAVYDFGIRRFLCAS